MVVRNRGKRISPKYTGGWKIYKNSFYKLMQIYTNSFLIKAVELGWKIYHKTWELGCTIRVEGRKVGERFGEWSREKVREWRQWNGYSRTWVIYVYLRQQWPIRILCPPSWPLCSWWTSPLPPGTPVLIERNGLYLCPTISLLHLRSQSVSL